MRLLLSIIFAVVFINSAAAEQKVDDNIYQLRHSLKLGDVKFSLTNQNPAAKQHFLLGLAFLHSFMYDLAIEQFKKAQFLEPGFALSYWGEAMANKHPIWNAENLKAAKNALNRYEAAKKNSALNSKELYKNVQFIEKERAYLRAVKLLFSNKSLRERDKTYLKAMEEFYNKYSNDPNIASFYALALLGYASDFPQDKNSQTYLQTGRKLIDKLYQRFPEHPGVLHYYLHYHDNSELNSNQEALPAARNALKIMSSSSHVTHMAAHIYRRLELWDQFIAANEISVKAADKLCRLLGVKPLYACNAENKYHSLEWLHYGYLQKGFYLKADKLVNQMAKIAAIDPAIEYQQWYYSMWARQVLSTQNWKTSEVIIKPIARPGNQLYYSAYTECGALLASSFLAIHQNKPIEKYLNRLDTLIRITESLEDPYIRQSCKIAALEVQTELAKQRKLNKKAQEYFKNTVSEQKKLISTELTPSLTFLPVEIYKREYFDKP